MIGHYLAALTAEQADRALLGKMEPGSYGYENEDSGCLVGTVMGPEAINKAAPHLWCPRSSWQSTWGSAHDSVEQHYDELCARFSTARVNTAIRNRILSNRAWRILHSTRAWVEKCRKNINFVACDVADQS